MPSLRAVLRAPVIVLQFYRPLPPESVTVSDDGFRAAARCRFLTRARHDAETPIVSGHALRHSLHRRLEVPVGRIDVEPLPQESVRSEGGKVGADGRVMLVFGSDQDAMPLPAS